MPGTSAPLLGRSLLAVPRGARDDSFSMLAAMGSPSHRSRAKVADSAPGDELDGRLRAALAVLARVPLLVGVTRLGWCGVRRGRREREREREPKRELPRSPKCRPRGTRAEHAVHRRPPCRTFGHMSACAAKKGRTIARLARMAARSRDRADVGYCSPLDARPALDVRTRVRGRPSRDLGALAPPTTNIGCLACEALRGLPRVHLLRGLQGPRRVPLLHELHRLLRVRPTA